MKKIILAASAAVIFSCAMGFANAHAYNSSKPAATPKATVSASCACTDCTCDDCQCSDCSNGSCDAGCCDNGCGGDCCKK